MIQVSDSTAAIPNISTGMGAINDGSYKPQLRQKIFHHHNMNSEQIVIPLKRFLLIPQCPTAWKSLDLYLFRDDKVIFYVGQSYLAYDRVWEHLMGGFKGHSIVGRFIWCNWPKSMNFTIELMSSQSNQFDGVGNDLNASERLLIQRWSPCFNLVWNDQPSPLPETYLPPNAPFRRRKSLNMLLHEAERAVKAEDAKRWLENIKDDPLADRLN